MDEQRQPSATYEELAKMIDHSLLRPELSEQDVAEGCRIAREYGVAAVMLRPSDVDLASRWLAGSGVRLGSVAGFPHGSGTTASKLYEAQDLLRRGVKEVDMVINIGKMISRQFQYVESELLQMANLCHQGGAILKVIFENAYLSEDLKIIACKICKRTDVDFAKTSTGFAPTGATMEDLRLMVRVCGERVKVKAAGGVRTLEKALEVHQVGCARFGATATAAILDDWKAHLAAQTAPPAADGLAPVS
ncbi:MAG TPA: deoxyribose-phosphate aldolase [Bryobacteraceae bacterium]|nr:deoxyribose-phosphate aldolase [Bryobacteraceae bacterium]